MFETNIDWTRWILSLIAIIGIMGGFAMVLKQIQMRRMGGKVGALKIFNNINPMRLNVVETRLVDARNKVCIIEKDDMEYTVVFTPGQATLIEAKTKPVKTSEEDNAA